MAKKRNGSPATKGLILLGVLAVPVVFVLAAMGTNFLMDSAPYALIAVLAIAIAIYTGTTCNLLYDYCETKRPFYSFIPCFGELAMMDVKFLKIGTPLYILALLFLGLSRLPYSVVSFLGQELALVFPFYATLIAFGFLGAIQIVKGIGILGCIKMVSDEWEDQMHGSLGFIKSFGWLGFIPFVRVMAVYGLNKPLSTLVTFNNTTISDNDDVVLEEEDEED